MTRKWLRESCGRTGTSLVVLLLVLLGLFVVILWPRPAPAQVRQLPHRVAPVEEPTLCQGCPTQAQVDRLKAFLAKAQPEAPPAAAAPPVVAPPAPATPIPPSPIAAPAAPPAPPAAPSTLPSPAPVVVGLGDLAGQALTWLVAAFGSILATVFAAWGIRLFKLAGVQISDAARDRLQAILLNGLNNAAVNVSRDVAGKGQIEIKDAVVAQAVTYAQTHGADTIKQLGLDPNNGATVEALKARIATLVADPSVPTPKVLDGKA